MTSRRLRSRRRLLVALLAAFGCLTIEPAAAADGVLVGGEFSYTVKAGDSLALTGARFAIEPRWLAQSNGLPPTARLRIGQVLQVDNRHVVPFSRNQGILINIPQRLLFLFQEGRLVAWYPAGLGRPDWPTPAGRSRVRALARNPTWHVPRSIQEEARSRNKPLQSHVPPGPGNPLGDYWIGLEDSGCGIHGTTAPASIYGFRTHGCVRLHPEDIAGLFSRVSRGLEVELVYEPVLLARDADGAVFLEVNPDVYGRQTDASGAAAALAERQGLQAILDPAAVARVIERKEGLARRVDVPAAP